MSKYRFRWWLDKEWSCPIHDSDVHEFAGPDGEYAEEPECLDCWFGSMRVVYDADGWATLNVAERSPFERLLMQHAEGMVKEMNRGPILLTELARERGDGKIDVPIIHWGNGPTSNDIGAAS